MTAYEKSLEVLRELFEKDCTFVLATARENVPSQRVVDACYTVSYTHLDVYKRQDLYMALAAKGDIVVFEHYERCQPAFLTVLSNLVQRGKSPLAGRYVLQNGRMVDAGNALVTDAVGALTPRGKYLVLLSETPVAKLADSFGAPFVSALGDICETAALTPESLSAVAKAERCV